MMMVVLVGAFVVVVQEKLASGTVFLCVSFLHTIHSSASLSLCSIILKEENDRIEDYFNKME